MTASMITSFPQLKQPTGSQSCLPTVVRAVLLWYGLPAQDVSQADVSNWCQEGPRGCWIDTSIEGLREHGFDVEELIEEADQQIRETVLDAEDAQPVIVTIKLPGPSFYSDHAVVILGIENRGGEEEHVVYMDPLTGQTETMRSVNFFAYWELAGGRALLVRP